MGHSFSRNQHIQDRIFLYVVDRLLVRAHRHVVSIALEKNEINNNNIKSGHVNETQ